MKKYFIARIYVMIFLVFFTISSVALAWDTEIAGCSVAFSVNYRSETEVELRVTAIKHNLFHNASISNVYMRIGKTLSEMDTRPYWHAYSGNLNVGYITASTFDGKFIGRTPGTVYYWQIKVEINGAVAESEIGTVKTLGTSDEPDPTQIAATSIKLSKSAISIKYGGTTQLKATVKPLNATFTWSTSDDKIATVSDSGTVKGVGVGAATISATSANGRVAKCKVTIKAVAPRALTILECGKTLTLFSGDMKCAYFDISLQPADFTLPNSDIKCTSSKSSVAKASIVHSDGTLMIEAKKPGTTVVKVYSWSKPSIKQSITVNVLKGKRPVSIAIEQAKVSLGLKAPGRQQTKLKATIAPLGATQSVTWKSLNPEVAKIDKNGVITARNLGTTKIVATSAIDSKLVATCEIAVCEEVWFPVDAMHITQLAYENYGDYSHGYYNDNAFDCIGRRGNAVPSIAFAPYTGTVTHIGPSNEVCFQSENDVIYANGEINKMTVRFLHGILVDGFTVGDTIKQGTPFYRESNVGTSAVHYHIRVDKGHANKQGPGGDVYGFDAFFINPNKTTSIIEQGMIQGNNMDLDATGAIAPDSWRNRWRYLPK